SQQDSADRLQESPLQPCQPGPRPHPRPSYKFHRQAAQTTPPAKPQIRTRLTGTALSPGAPTRRRTERANPRPAATAPPPPAPSPRLRAAPFAAPYSSSSAPPMPSGYSPGSNSTFPYTPQCPSTPPPPGN